MKIWSQSFEADRIIPPEFAFCERDPSPSGQPLRFAPNRNPHLAWSEIPAAAKMLVLVCVDPDAPASPELVNRDNVSIPADFPRADFYHWAVVNLPPESAAIEEGQYASGVTVKGKDPAAQKVLEHGQQGINDYTGWFAGDDGMKGQYGGYDGPCPPWNDRRIHRYRFELYALDTPSLNLPAPFTGHDVKEAIKERILAVATLEATYTLNINLMNPPALIPAPGSGPSL